jgi:hypothetical protein
MGGFVHDRLLFAVNPVCDRELEEFKPGHQFSADSIGLRNSLRASKQFV